jgi:hypothetical protein
MANRRIARRIDEGLQETRRLVRTGNANRTD